MPDPVTVALSGRAVLRISRMLELVSRQRRARIEGRRDRARRDPTEDTASRRSSEGKAGKEQVPRHANRARHADEPCQNTLRS
jgi:hypothetical protein